MPLTDYAATPGGSLKLKGGAATNGKITKHKKKKKKPPPEQQAPQNKSSGPTSTSTDTLAAALDRASERKTSEGEGEQDTEYTEAGPEGERDAVVVYGAGKTEAERRHEETRKRRLDERLKREGVKTHKERVEELNRYLSNLSEHHDMPRIGPG